jgi:hypothetical protein
MVLGMAPIFNKLLAIGSFIFPVNSQLYQLLRANGTKTTPNPVVFNCGKKEKSFY